VELLLVCILSWATVAHAEIWLMLSFGFTVLAPAVFSAGLCVCGNNEGPFTLSRGSSSCFSLWKATHRAPWLTCVRPRVTLFVFAHAASHTHYRRADDACLRQRTPPPRRTCCVP
jgi:hypothetical protein